MIEGYGAVTQALLGTLLTWGLTAAGAGFVVFLKGNHVSLSLESGIEVARLIAVLLILEKDARCVAGLLGGRNGRRELLVTSRTRH